MARTFFFSYAHNDSDDLLEKFFAEINGRVRKLSGISADGYRDKKLRGGDEWSKELLAELRSTPAMVCIYSESYFNSSVCGSEMQVFLERRLRHIRENAGSRPANIIPVLWQATDRIPVSLPDFQYEKPLSTDRPGLWDVLDRSESGDAFKEIARRVALRVKEAIKVPLPDLGYEPPLGGVPSAFEPPPLPPEEFDNPHAVSGPECVTYVYASSPPWTNWPFAPKFDPLLRLSAAVAKGRDLSSHQLTFDPGQGSIVPRLEKVQRKNNLLVFLVDGTSLADAALRARLQEYDGQRLDVCSTLIVWPPGARTPALRQFVDQAFPSLSRREPPAFYPEIDHPDQFIDAVGRSLDALRTAVIKAPLGIPSLTPTSTFRRVPSVEGPGERRAA